MGSERMPPSPRLRFLIEGLSGSAVSDSAQLLELIASAGVDADELEPWADYNHSPLDSYGRQLVWHGGHFEVMVMTWLPGDFSAIHDHGYAQWGAVQCFGSAEHHTYNLKGRHLDGEVSLPYSPGQIRLVNRGLIHQMGNSGSESFLSLHIYGSDVHRAAITGSARVFAVDEGRIQLTNGGVFFGLPDREILRSQYGLTADPRILHRQLQLKTWRAAHALAHVG